MKPRVLLIGDSITVAYSPTTIELLKDTADVEMIPQNGGPTTLGLEQLSRWLGDTPWDIIHFNWGLHDLKIMEDGKHQVPASEYEANLRELVRRMQATGARLIWASTTPVPVGVLNPWRKPDDAVTYNDIARAIMEENGIAIDDLHSFALPRIAELQRPNDVHFSDTGSQVLGEAVAEMISRELELLAK